MIVSIGVFAKAKLPTSSITLEFIVTVFRFAQLRKADALIFVTVFGITILSMLEFSNRLSAITVRLGKTTDLKVEFANAPLAISVTLAGIVILVTPSSTLLANALEAIAVVDESIA